MPGKSSLQERNSELVEILKSEFAPRKPYVYSANFVIYNVNNFGATGDGVTDDWVAIQSAAATVSTTGGILYFPNPRYIVSAPITISGHGVRIWGNGAVWDTMVQGTTIEASAGFAGASIIIFRHSVVTYIRSVGMWNITIDGGAASNCHGVNVVRAYDFCMFENVMVQDVSDTKYAWYFSSDSDSSGQTVTIINCIGRHRSNAATADTWHIEKLNEVVMIECKGWAGTDSTYGASGATCFNLWACSGITLYDCTAAFTTGVGFHIEKGIVGKGHDVHLVNCQAESCKTPVDFASLAWRLMGAITTIPAVGSVVDQGAVSGVVTFATALGIYVKETTGGAWANGIIFQGGGNIGNLTSIDNDRITNFSLENPQIKGSGVSPFTLTFSQLDNGRVKLNSPSGSDVFTVTVASTCLRLSLDIPPVIAVTDNAVSTYTNYVGYRKTVFTSDTGASYRLRPAFKGEVVDIIKDDGGSNEYVIHAAVGETIDGQPDVYISGNATVGYASMRLVCYADGAWTIEAFTGRYCLYTGATRLKYKWGDNQELDLTASSAIGQQHVGRVITNAGAGASCTFTLSLSTVLPGAEFTFIKIANQTMRVDPNASDEFRGGTGLGKYLQIANVGDSVKIRCCSANMWEIVAAMGAYTFE